MRLTVIEVERCEWLGLARLDGELSEHHRPRVWQT